MGRKVCISLAVALSAFLIGCTDVPNHTNPWLSYKFNSNAAIDDTAFAFSYYLGLGIADPDNYTFGVWLAENGFPQGGADARAVYANLNDLQFGRDMNCWQYGQKIACYVQNYGETPLTKGVKNGSWPDITGALHDATTGPPGAFPFGTVAMVYDPNINGPNQVSFYAFGTKLGPDVDSNGDLVEHDNALLYDVILDQEGPKTVPRMCMACHGGRYDMNSNTAGGAVFLPFDVFAFRYPGNTGYSFDEQQEALRKLNAFVVATNPNQGILDLINGLYPSGVTVAGNTAVDGYVPSGWSTNPTLYTSVVRTYCRTCHLAQPNQFTASDQFAEQADGIKSMICDMHDMPHAQVPYGLGDKIGFWNDRVAQQDLGNFFKSQHVMSCLPSD